MAKLPDPTFQLKSSVVAGLLLAAMEQLRNLGAALPETPSGVLALTGTSRTQAYEMKGRVQAACATLHASPGRAPAPAPKAAPMAAVLRAVRDWLYTHPGAVIKRQNRQEYSDGFRRFVVSLAAEEPGVQLSVAELSDATGVPLGTLKEWLSPSVDPSPESASQPTPPHNPEDPMAMAVDPAIATIITTYRGWTGGFAAFCDHLRTEHDIQRGRTFISKVLQAAGLRSPSPRRGYQQAPWSRGTFRRLFPGAQGSQMAPS